jgi:hypothetical protein
VALPRELGCVLQQGRIAAQHTVQPIGGTQPKKASVQGLRAIAKMRGDHPGRSRVRGLALRLPGGSFASDPFRQHKGVVKPPQNLLQIFEALYGRIATAEQSAIQLGGISEPATAPTNGMQSHGSEVSAQSA